MRVAYEGCPLCGSSFTQFGEAPCVTHPRWVEPIPDAIPWCECDLCGHVFTAGYFTDEALGLLFSTEEPKVGVDHENRRWKWARTVADIAGHIPVLERGRWLDVGFGDAATLFVASELGFVPVGLDLRQTSVDALSACGVEAHCVDVVDFTDSGFDVVSMFDVVEHTPFPRKTIQAAARLVRPGGVVAVSVPNRDSPSWRFVDAEGRNPYWIELEHYHNFSRASIVELLVDAGLTPTSVTIGDRFRFGVDIVARKG